MNLWPALLTSTAPSPRRASVASGAGSRPTSSAVGWNCTKFRIRDHGPGARRHADAAAARSTGSSSPA